MPGVFPVDIDKAAFSGAPAPSSLSAEEKIAYERLQFVYSKGIAYGFQMGLRPQTLTGLADSPVGLAAYFLDHDARSYELIARVFNGHPEGLTRDDILTWTTQGAVRPGWSDAQGDKSDSDLRERVGGNNMANLKKGRSLLHMAEHRPGAEAQIQAPRALLPPHTNEKLSLAYYF